MLKLDVLLNSYRQGIFPMAIDGRGTIAWFSPDPRALIPLDDRFHIPHGLRRSLKRNRFEVTIDQAFEEVMRACASSHADTWISEELVRSYVGLHEAGFAHSVETRLEGRLVGGLYGVSLGGAFFGESMFHRETDASKVALVALIERLRRAEFELLDTQWTTPHLEQFGAYVVPRREYLKMLSHAVELKRSFDG